MGKRFVIVLVKCILRRSLVSMNIKSVLQNTLSIGELTLAYELNKILLIDEMQRSAKRCLIILT